MILNVSLQSVWARVAATILAVACSLLFLLVITSNLIAGVFADERVEIEREQLLEAIRLLPDTARLHARLAQAETAGEGGSLANAEFHASRAVDLSPWDYTNRVLLATIRESRGDRTGAEESLRTALTLAPNYADVHWRLANLLLRSNDADESVAQFRLAVKADPSLQALTLDLIWHAFGADLSRLESVTGDETGARIGLARFLLKKSRATEAVSLFNTIPREGLLAVVETGLFLDGLIEAGQVSLARTAWLDLVAGNPRDQPWLWNGSFESDSPRNLSQFDWTIRRSDYAQIGVDAEVARSGNRSLRVGFVGRDTTRLDREITQLLFLSPGARYKLECYARAGRLTTPEGPRVVVSLGSSGERLAATDPVPSGATDWIRLTTEFTVPRDSRGDVHVSVKRQPRFSYDDPTRGTIWFDDFTLSLGGPNR